MPAPGTTGELYSEADNPSSTLGAPPSAPAPVPQPTQPVKVTEPVVTKARMADEGPDGKVRDTSTEALRPGNDLGFRNVTDEEETARHAKPAEEAKPAADKKPPEAAKPAEPPAPAPEKVYAGKFKSVEELEKAYNESQSRMTKATQEAAELRNKVAATPPPAPTPKTPSQLAAEEAEKAQFLERFVADPKGVITQFQQQAVQQTQVALAAQQTRQEWLAANPDLVEHERYVASEATFLMQADPELAKDPVALLSRATDNYRQLTGKLRAEGAREALTQETRVIPLVSGTTSASTEQPSSQGKAPLTFDDAYSAHLKMLKEQEQKSHRGLRR